MTGGIGDHPGDQERHVTILRDMGNRMALHVDGLRATPGSEPGLGLHPCDGFVDTKQGAARDPAPDPSTQGFPPDGIGCIPGTARIQDSIRKNDRARAKRGIETARRAETRQSEGALLNQLAGGPLGRKGPEG